MILKTCPDCGLAKALSEYAGNAARPDGRAFYCKPCFNARSAAAYRRKQGRAGKTVRERLPVPEGSKRCPCCAQVKPLDAFHRAPYQSGGRSSFCAVCKGERERRARFERVYGLTETDVARLVEQQEGRCALCREDAAVHVDHDHASGEVRGVLCFRCNVGLGHFRDRPALLRRAIDYLETTTWQRTQVCTGAFRLTSPRRGAPRSPSSSGLQHLISSRRAGSSRPG